MKKDWFRVSFYIELPEEEIKNIDIYSHLDFLPDCKKYKRDNVCIWRVKEYSKKH